MVVPADAFSAMWLCDMRERLVPATFPLPAKSVLATLNDMGLPPVLATLGAPVPRTLRSQAAGLDVASAMSLGFPLVIKPTNKFGVHRGDGGGKPCPASRLGGGS